MSLLVDTTVWSLAFRRDDVPKVRETNLLAKAISQGIEIWTTGLILQEVLQGFSGPKQRSLILDKFTDLSFVGPTMDDHVAAAELGNTCRRAGVQLKTVDALLAQLSIRHELPLLTTDQDFVHASKHIALSLA